MGREQYTIYPTTIEEQESVTTWIGSLDAKLVMGPVWVMGQGWLGANVNGLNSNFGIRRTSTVSATDTDAYGAPVQTVTGVDPVAGHGAWGELGVAAREGLIKIVGGAGFEASKSDEVAAGGVGEQGGVFGGIHLAPHRNFDGSVEYYHGWTKYNVADPAENVGQMDSVSLNVRAKF